MLPALARLRLTTWLLITWAVVSVGWLAAKSMTLALCPMGQGGCDQTAQITTTGELLPWAMPLLALGAALLALWAWDRRSTPDTLPVTDEPAPARWRFRPARAFLAAFVGIAIGAHVLLFAPMVESPFCATPVHLNDRMAYVINCDSYAFMDLAQHPERLLDANNPRQSRPGYVAVAAVLERTVGKVASAVGIGEAYGQRNSAFIPLVLLNLLVVAAAAALLAWLVRELGASRWVAATLGSLLIFNEVGKAFFWTAHQQMFAFFVPIATIALARWFLLRRPGWKAVIAAGVGVALASLFYGSFVITVGVVTLLLLARGWKGLGLAAAFLAAFAIPNVLWIVICKAISGTYFNNETELYDQFLWIPHAAEHGIRPLYYAVQTMAVTTVRNVMGIGLIAILLLLAAAVLAVLTRARVRTADPSQRAILIGTGLTFLISVLFVFGIGILPDRLAYHAIPPLLIAAGYFAARASWVRSGRLAVNVVLGAGALAAIVVALTTEGPYS